jgi:hypothetical protein
MAAVAAGEYPWYAPEVYDYNARPWAPHSPWARYGLPPSLRPPLPEVPDMIVFSDDDIDWDGDGPNWWDDPDDWVNFLDWDDDFVPFEVLKKC